MQRLYTILAVLFTVTFYAQEFDYAYSNIPEVLLENANSVVRYESFDIDIPNQSTININFKRAITILNSRGDRDTQAFVYYDDVTRVKSVHVTIYDKSGNEIQKIKKRDFRDVSAVDGISLYTDTRLLYLNYTPTSYPYTLEIESETTSKNTMAIPSFYANDGYFSSTQEKHMKITSAQDLGLKHKLFGEIENIEIVSTPTTLDIHLENVPSIVQEIYSKGFRNVVGYIAIGLDSFHLEGVDGNAQSWKIFGKWLHDNLLEKSQDLPDDAVTTIKERVIGIDDPIEKARIVYDYVQEKTRYISVQVGIGGWKPMKASQVDNLGYGDCKALTSYTQSLLSAVGVPSYYTILYGGFEKRDIVSDFAGIQGNHAILSIPNDDDYIWLECTNQTVPFGFIAGFTDDRDVLVVKPEGGEIVRTKKYSPSDNFQVVRGSYTIDKEGNAIANVHMESGGLQYGNRYDLMNKNEDDQKKHYYNFWNYLNNVSLNTIELFDDQENVKFTEDVSFEVKSYGSFAGEEMLVPINLFNRYTNVPERVRDRRLPVSISRGFKDVDEIELRIPEGFKIHALPEDKNLETKFGNYSIKFTAGNDGTMSYKRTFELFEGEYEQEKYTDFRKFIRQIVRNDQQKIIIKKS